MSKRNHQFWNAMERDPSHCSTHAHPRTHAREVVPGAMGKHTFHRVPKSLLATLPNPISGTVAAVATGNTPKTPENQPISAVSTTGNTTADQITVTLRPEGPGADAVIRFRRALKWMLRSHGLRAIEVKHG